MYNSLPIFLIALGLFFVGLFLLQYFPPKEVTVAFVIKLIWWCQILFNFCLSGKLLIFLSILNENLAG